MKKYISVNDPAKISIKLGEWYEITDYLGNKLPLQATPLEITPNGYIRAKTNLNGIVDLKRGEFLRKVKKKVGARC